MIRSIENAHIILNHSLTAAAVTAKTSKRTLKIPYKDLLESIGQTTTKEIDLILTIETSWDQPAAPEEY